MTDPRLTRRAFGGAVLIGAAVPALAACGSDEPEPSGGSGDGALVATDDVPVNGGVVLKDAEVVVVQPAEGEFKCFTSVCTHAGCTVGEVSDNRIVCPCHGSTFSAEDGSVVKGPATEPLAEVAVEVAGGQVTRA